MTRRQAVKIVKPPITWILVADSKQAQIFSRQRVEKHRPRSRNGQQFEEMISHPPVPVPNMQWQAESADQYDIGRNATGMVFESASSSRHMSEPHVEVHDAIRTRFAKTIAEHLDHARELEVFDRLVLVAPAKMLGEIRRHLSPKVLKKVVAEMPKELTQYNGEELAEHLDHIA